jgi:hypothetical protein
MRDEKIATFKSSLTKKVATVPARRYEELEK